MTPTEYKNFLRASFEDFLKAMDRSVVPQDPYLEYEYPYIAAARWHLLADLLIQDELREVTNRIHEWHDMLQRWHAWNQVAAAHAEIRAWDLRREFMNPLMHTCLLMPSAMRDLFVFVATNAIHQISLSRYPTYPDNLEGDPSALDPHPRPLSRRQKERRLTNIAKKVPQAVDFVKSLWRLDDEEYRTTTKDYRNLNSHAIGPRIALGNTRLVTRTVVPSTRLETQGDGTSRLVPIPGKYTATYGFGGLEPLDLEIARESSLSQYRIARSILENLLRFVQHHADALPRAAA